MNDIVVIAEDNSEIANGFARVFLQNGYECHVVSTVEGIMPAVEGCRPSWVLMDLVLEDGLSTPEIEQLKAKFGGEVYIIVVSGNVRGDGNGNHSTKGLLAMGADYVIQKPVEYRVPFMVCERQKIRAGYLFSGRYIEISLDSGEGKILIDLSSNWAIVSDEEGKETERRSLSLTYTRLLAIMVASSSQGADGIWTGYRVMCCWKTFIRPIQAVPLKLLGRVFAKKSTAHKVLLVRS